MIGWKLNLDIVKLTHVWNTCEAVEHLLYLVIIPNFKSWESISVKGNTVKSFGALQNRPFG